MSYQSIVIGIMGFSTSTLMKKGLCFELKSLPSELVGFENFHTPYNTKLLPLAITVTSHEELAFGHV